MPPGPPTSTGSTVVRGGKAVQIWYDIYDYSNINPILFDPPSLPLITIIDPTTARIVNQQPMTRVRKGLYTFIFVTPSTGPTGIWGAFVDVVDTSGLPGGSVDYVIPQAADPVFQLVI
jgi:hypothetical protein